MARFIFVSICIYVGSLILWILARAAWGDKFLPVLFMNFLGVWLFSPIVILGISALVLRQKPGIYLLIIPFVLFLVFYGPFLVPRKVQEVKPDSPIKLLTFNLRYTNTNVLALEKVLISSRADILALQEVAKPHEDMLSSALGELYPYHAFYDPAGLAFYSKYPFGEYKITQSSGWPLQSAVINISQRQFLLINAHFNRAGILEFLLTWNAQKVQELEASRNHQIDLINHIIEETDIPVIVACDGNMTNLNTGYSKLTSKLRDAFKEQGRGLGHTLLVPRAFEIASKINLPVQRIDYLFHSPEIRVHQVDLIARDSGSDHVPVWAEFDLAP